MKLKALKKLLETPFWPEGLDLGHYFRTQDDCDGNLEEGISITASPDGDVFVSTNSRPCQSCRYRMPMSGGGNSPRTRQALLLLALAIKLDNEEGKHGTR